MQDIKYEITGEKRGKARYNFSDIKELMSNDLDTAKKNVSAR